MTRRRLPGLGSLAAAAALCAALAAQSRTTLDIYFIDVEGGQSTLVVTPAGEALLVDTGFPGAGGFDALPGDPAAARDAQRILAAARDAGCGVALASHDAEAVAAVADSHLRLEDGRATR